MNIIKSEDNKKIKYIKSLKNKKNRLRDMTFILEGKKVILEAINEGAEILEIFVSESFFNNEKIGEFGSVNIISDQIFNKISDTVNSQGIVATCKLEIHDLEDILPFGRYILLDGLSDPGNMGGIIRGADAFSFDGVILGPNCVDVMNEKVVRSTMASIFRVNLFNMKSYDDIAILNRMFFRIIATTLEGDSKAPKDSDLKDNIIVAIGNEANGVSKELLEKSGERIHIPMPGNAESLNANVAASIIMYESDRQKNA